MNKIDILEEKEKKAYDNLIMLKYFTMEKEDKESIDIILKLVEALIAENKELKEKNKELEEELEKEKEKNKELESDIQQKNFEIKCLNSDIKNMYCEEGVIAILEDNFDLSREEAIQILEEE